MANLWTVVIVFGSVLYSGIFAEDCVGHNFYADSNDCQVYYRCDNGQIAKFSCPDGLHWSPKGHCDWPATAGCDSKDAEKPATTSTTTPKPTTAAPKPTTAAPKPTTAAPKPTTAAPKPTTAAPKPTTAAPNPGNELVSQLEFQLAAQTKGGYPDRSYYTGFINSLAKAGITTRREAILFLAHATWETVGFIYTKEVYCQTNLQDCLRAYPNNQGGIAGKVYYGRGMMQLTWDYNYKAASAYLYGDDRLLQDPDQVGTDPAVGWQTAAWYWFANVHTRSQSFGSTLKAINGALECEGGSHGQNRYLRFMHYKQILQALGEPTPSDDDGWCTAW